MKNILKCIKLGIESNIKTSFIYLILTIISGIFSGITIFSLQELINRIQNYILKGDSIVNTIVLFLFINIVGIVLKNIQQIYYSKLTLSISQHIEVKFIEKCTMLGVEDFESEKIYNKINQIDRYGKDKVLEVFFNSIQLFEGIISIFSIIWIVISFQDFYWMLILIVPVCNFIIFLKIGRHIYEIEELNTHLYRKHDYCNFLMTNDIAVKERVSCGYGNYILNKLIVLNKILYDRNYRLSKLAIGTNGLFEGVEFFIKSVLIIVKVKFIFSNRLPVGEIMGYSYSLESITDKVKVLLGNLLDIYKDSLYIRIFFEFLEQETINNKGKKIDCIEKIEIKNLRYQYDGNEKKLIFKEKVFNRGKIYVVNDKNGSGKSTFIKIISGLYLKYEGDVLINDENLQDLDLLEYRKKVAVVFQNHNKYETTLRENICLGSVDRTYSDEYLKQIMKTLEFDEDIYMEKDGLDNMLGNWFGGRDLSGGQWQKVAIARSIIKESEIIIMDEPTSSLDEKSKNTIYNLLMKLSKTHIVILVTHDLHTINLDNVESISIINK